jgi:hypothetical protein
MQQHPMFFPLTSFMTPPTPNLTLVITEIDVITSPLQRIARPPVPIEPTKRRDLGYIPSGIMVGAMR